MTQAPGVAIVTGASRGIGEAIAKRLANEGHAVVVNYASSPKDAERVVNEIRNEGGRAVSVRADVSRSEEVRQLFDHAEEEFGDVTIVVNNAGVNLPRPQPMVETDEDTFDHIFGVNTRGAFLMMREAGRRMSGGGRIVNITSTVNAMSVPGMAAYGGSKAAVEAMTNLFSKELDGRDINVNCVAPGPTGTELFFQGKTEEQINHFTKYPPTYRLGTPEEIASVVAFLVGPDSTFVNGQVLKVNGGVVS